MTPAALFALTPHRLFGLFFRSAPAGEADPVSLLARHNAGRAARGLPPVVPGWFWKDRRRRRR